ncbi:hypothetical protein Tco_1045165 [Tanacetum coccineum]|uniref:Uncharacterized protein n=1 Tax=Tanacetum coccineum TaxID=301880 RepID=A0ABQ5GS37_9ASTR
MSVVRLQTCLTEILGFLEKFVGGFEQDIDDEDEEDKEDEEGDGEDGGTDQGDVVKVGMRIIRIRCVFELRFKNGGDIVKLVNHLVSKWIVGRCVVRLQTCLTEILGFLGKFVGGFEQDIDDEDEEDKEDAECDV